MTFVDTSYSISETAEVTGLTTHTLRYHEREGLMLRSVDRASSRHRRYVELAREGDFTSVERLELLREHRASVISQLDEVAESLAAIDLKITLYQERIPGP